MFPLLPILSLFKARTEHGLKWQFKILEITHCLFHPESSFGTVILLAWSSLIQRLQIIEICSSFSSQAYFLLFILKCDLSFILAAMDPSFNSSQNRSSRVRRDVWDSFVTVVNNAQRSVQVSQRIDFLQWPFQLRIITLYLHWLLDCVSPSVSLFVRLSSCLSICLSFCMPVFLYACLSVCLSFFLSVFLFVCFHPVFLYACISFCLLVILSFCMPVFLFVCLSCHPVFLYACISFCLFVILSFCMPVFLLVFLSFCMPVFLSVFLSLCMPVFLSVFLSFCMPGLTTLSRNALTGISRGSCFRYPGYGECLLLMVVLRNRRNNIIDYTLVLLYSMNFIDGHYFLENVLIFWVFSFCLQLHWLDVFGKRRYFVTLGPNQRRLINTYRNTRWVASDEASSSTFLLNGKKEYTAQRNSELNRVEVFVTRPGMCIHAIIPFLLSAHKLKRYSQRKGS